MNLENIYKLFDSFYEDHNKKIISGKKQTTVSRAVLHFVCDDERLHSLGELSEFFYKGITD